MPSALTRDNPHLSRLTRDPFAEGPRLGAGCSQQVRDYLAGALAENTLRAYRADLEHFLSWGGSIPSTPEVIAEYLANHAPVLAMATLDRRLVTIAKAHRVLGVANPTASELVQATRRGIRRRHGRAQRQARPLTRESLFAVLEAMGDDLRATRDRALLLVGFAGAFRRSELCAPGCTDVAFVADGMIIHLRRGKTDQEGIGREVAIPFGRSRWCPVRGLRNWLEGAGIKVGPVFRSINRYGVVSDRVLSAESVSLIIKERVAAIGLDPSEFSGHSLRAGLATSAAAAGVPISTIKQQTGHSADQMLSRYIRQPDAFRHNAVRALL